MICKFDTSTWPQRDVINSLVIGLSSSVYFWVAHLFELTNKL